MQRRNETFEEKNSKGCTPKPAVGFHTGHGVDAGRSAGGFIHGFRYLVRGVATLARSRLSAAPAAAWPRAVIPKAALPARILRRASSASSTFQCFGLLCDLYVYDATSAAFAVLEDVPATAPVGEIVATLAPDLADFAFAARACVKADPLLDASEIPFELLRFRPNRTRFPRFRRDRPVRRRLVVSPTPERAERGVPEDSFRTSQGGSTLNRLVPTQAKATFEYNRHWSSPAAVRHGAALTPVAHRAPLAFADRAALLQFLDDEGVSRVYRVGPDGGDFVVNELIHPVVRFYDEESRLLDLLHIDEELAVFFLFKKHVASALFLAAIVEDLAAGGADRALGHVLLDPTATPLRAWVDAYE